MCCSLLALHHSCEAQLTTVGIGGDADASHNVYKRINEVPALLDASESAIVSTFDATALLQSSLIDKGDDHSHHDEGLQQQQQRGGEGTTTGRSSSSSSSTFPIIWQILIVQGIISALAYGAIPAILPIASTGYQDESHILQYSSFVSMTADPLLRALTHVCRCYKLNLLLLGKASQCLPPISSILTTLCSLSPPSISHSCRLCHNSHCMRQSLSSSSPVSLPLGWSPDHLRQRMLHLLLRLHLHHVLLLSSSCPHHPLFFL